MTLLDRDTYLEEYNESFEYEWVSEEKMTEDECKVWDHRGNILDLLEDQPVEEINSNNSWNYGYRATAPNYYTYW